MLGAFHSEPKFLAIFPSLNARRFSVRTEVSVDVYQFGCKVFFREDQNSWRRVLVLMRGVFRSGTKFLAVFSNLDARRCSARTKIPGGFPSVLKVNEMNR